MFYTAAPRIPRHLLALSIFILALCAPLPAHALEKATVQLKWLHHFQFAGYYAALDKGFYKEAGLDVSILEGGPAVEVEDQVTSGRADFGVGTSALLLHRGHGDDLVVLGQIFQHSPAIFLTPRKAGIRSIADLAGRRVMYSNQHGDVLTLLKKNGIKESDIIQVPHQGDPRDLISGKADAMVAYSFNEPFILEHAGEPYLSFSPRTYGIDFYGDNFFTTRQTVEARPEFVEAFREATLRGWRYALANKAEIANLILARYSKEKSFDWLMFEANQMDMLIQPSLVELGYQNPSRWKQIGEVFTGLGMLPKGFDPTGIIYSPKPRNDFRLLFGTALLSMAIIVVLAAVALTFRVLNRNLRAEIAERKLAEGALGESEERLRIIFETSQAGIIMVDRAGIVTFANRRMAEMFGYPLEELIGSPYTKHIHPQDNRQGDAQMRKLIAGEIDHVYTERRYLNRDGSDFWGYLSGKRLETDGELRALVGIIADITDRKTTEDARGKELIFIENLLAQSPMGVRVFDGATGKCVRVNQAAADIAGGTIDALLHHNFRELSSWREAELVTLADAVLSDGLTRRIETELHTTFGKQIMVRYFLSRFFVEEASHLLVIGQDATEENRLEQENKRIESQMLNMQKLESLGVLAGGIAHDFNNILTGIMGNVTLAQMLVDPSHKARTPLLKAEKASQRAAELASQLLTFAKGGQPIKKAVSVKALAAESVSLVLRGTNVRSTVDLPDSLAIIEADEGQINQAFNNILINAVHAMPGGGTLNISGSNAVLESSNRMGLLPGGYIKLVFSDEGCGISPEDQKKIFDPYFTTKTSGTGLGLASTHSIIHRHGGRILVESELGLGTSFTIYLPSLAKTAKASVPVEAPSIASRGGGSILVMDDEEMIRDLACVMLEELGYRVQTCANGEEVVARYRSAFEAGTPFSAVIMDLTVPGAMGGKIAAEQIMGIDRSARLIVSSGYSNDPVMAEHATFGFCATLIKPYRATEVAQVLNDSL